MGTTNICERLKGIVTESKPNVLTGLNQKVCGRNGLSYVGHHGHIVAGAIGRVRPIPKFMWNWVSPSCRRQRQANRKERCWHGG